MLGAITPYMKRDCEWWGRPETPAERLSVSALQLLNPIDTPVPPGKENIYSLVTQFAV